MPQPDGRAGVVLARRLALRGAFALAALPASAAAFAADAGAPPVAWRFEAGLLVWALAAALLLVGGIPRPMLGRVRSPPVVGPALGRLWGFAGMMLYNAVVLAWHVPALYEAALRSEHVHDLEHLCFLLGAMLFWAPVLLPLDRPGGRPGAAWRLAAVLITIGTPPSARTSISSRACWTRPMARRPGRGAWSTR